MLVKTPEGNILEMNVSSIPRGSNQHVFVTVRKGGHIQRIINTACSSPMIAYELLVEVAEEIRAGISVIGTSNGQPYVKTAGVWR